MASIQAQCPSCGKVTLQSRDLEVRTCVDTWASMYFFVCPFCHLTEVKPASQPVVNILTKAGVRCVEWRRSLGANGPGDLLNSPTLVQAGGPPEVLAALINPITSLSLVAALSLRPLSQTDLPHPVPPRVSFECFAPEQVWSMFVGVE